MVFLTYVIVGGAGYIGFSGHYFNNKKDATTGIVNITDNFLNMFNFDAIPAILIRSMIFV